MNDKRKYETPKLREWGNVVELTKLGRSNGPGDAVFSDGSVFNPAFPS